MFLNPILIIIYIIFIYILLKLLQYGKGFIPYDIPILITLGITIFTWVIICIVLAILKKELIMVKWKQWIKVALVLFVSLSLFTGYKIFDMATHYNSALGMKVSQNKKTKEFELKNDNLFEGGFISFINEIKTELVMPTDLYISSDVNIKCQYDGRISSFDLYVYGKIENEIKSYLISYKSGAKATVIIGGYTSADYQKEKRLSPFLDALKVINMREYVEPFQVKYSGIQSLGYNNENIYYIDLQGEKRTSEVLSHEIYGYTVEIIPTTSKSYLREKRYIYVDNLNQLPKPPVQKGDDNSEDKDLNSMINDMIGYKLKIMDAAAGSRFYSLFKSDDGGVNWIQFNKDPFLGEIGVSHGIKFFSEDIGYIGMSHSGNEHASLYVTEDGGRSFKKLDLKREESFDYYNLPYKEEGLYYLKITKARESDQPNDYMMYVSNNGVDWNLK